MRHATHFFILVALVLILQKAVMADNYLADENLHFSTQQYGDLLKVGIMNQTDEIIDDNVDAEAIESCAAKIGHEIEIFAKYQISQISDGSSLARTKHSSSDRQRQLRMINERYQTINKRYQAISRRYRTVEQARRRIGLKENTRESERRPQRYDYRDDVVRRGRDSEEVRSQTEQPENIRMFDRRQKDRRESVYMASERSQSRTTNGQYRTTEEVRRRTGQTENTRRLERRTRRHDQREGEFRVLLSERSQSRSGEQHNRDLNRRQDQRLVESMTRVSERSERRSTERERVFLKTETRRDLTNERRRFTSTERQLSDKRDDTRRVEVGQVRHRERRDKSMERDDAPTERRDRSSRRDSRTDEENKRQRRENTGRRMDHRGDNNERDGIKTRRINHPTDNKDLAIARISRCSDRNVRDDSRIGQLGDTPDIHRRRVDERRSDEKRSVRLSLSPRRGDSIRRMDEIRVRDVRRQESNGRSANVIENNRRRLSDNFNRNTRLSVDIRELDTSRESANKRSNRLDQDSVRMDRRLIRNTRQETDVKTVRTGLKVRSETKDVRSYEERPISAFRLREFDFTTGEKRPSDSRIRQGEHMSNLQASQTRLENRNDMQRTGANPQVRDNFTFRDRTVRKRNQNINRESIATTGNGVNVRAGREIVLARTDDRQERQMGVDNLNSRTADDIEMKTMTIGWRWRDAGRVYQTNHQRRNNEYSNEHDYRAMKRSAYVKNVRLPEKRDVIIETDSARGYVRARGRDRRTRQEEQTRRIDDVRLTNKEKSTPLWSLDTVLLGRDSIVRTITVGFVAVIGRSFWQKQV